jgi:hypothetical protein
MSRRPFIHGQRAWSPTLGWGTVEIMRRYETCPVKLIPEKGYPTTFTPDGRGTVGSILPTLFHNEVKPEDWPDPDPPRPELQIDDPVWVLDVVSRKWFPRHFAGWSDSGMLVFLNGKTSRTSHGVEIVNDNYYHLGPTKDNR